MDLYSEFAKFNIDSVGVCDASPYNAVMGTDYKVCIVAIFPYFCGYPEKSNISIYAHGLDYHRVINRILGEVAKTLDTDSYCIHADIGPEIDRTLCINAGLAFRGRNGMCINEKYGSYFFVGYIACNAPFEPAEPSDRECLGCMKCVSACPGSALDSGFCEDKCLSAITQKKGELNPWESELVACSGTAFGCDICQMVCPHNRYAKHTPIEEFSRNKKSVLTLDELEGMSNKQFKETYGNRAFAWRGKTPLIRNLRLINNILPKRKPTRLKGYDYSQNGAYFITICTNDRKCILGNIVGQGLAPAEMILSQYGKIAKEQLLDLENRYKTIKIDKYVIMPNHIHIIVSLENTAGASPCPTISDVVCSFKSLTTRRCGKSNNKRQKIFQTSFHDHVIRGEKDYQKIWEYIDTNILKWKSDCFYNDERS